MKCLLVSCAVVLFLAAPLLAEDMTIDLRYVPSAADPAPGLSSAVKQLRPVRIGAFTDTRESADTYVGELNANGQVTRLRASTALAVYATDVFRRVYGEWGGKSSADDQLLLKGEVTQFRFEDAAGYQARVGFHFSLQDDSGQVLWDGHTSGILRGTGRTLSPENISAIISDILRATYGEMLEDDKLVGVWSGKTNSDSPPPKVSQKSHNRTQKKTVAGIKGRQKKPQTFEVGFRQ